MSEHHVRELGLRYVISDVKEERRRQDEKWGGPEHDDAHERRDFVRFTREHLDDARNALARNDDFAEWRKEMVRVAALAIAAIESHDRRMSK